MSVIIESNQLNFAYSKREKVLQDVSFTVEQGEFIGIVGPNGAGKTTLLKLILGLLKPQSGKLFIKDKSIGYVPQFKTFKRDFPITVNDVVLMGRLSNSRFPKCHFSNTDKKIAAEVLAKLEIQNLATKPIDTLSGGQLQKVMVARALISKPKILLLDEPTANIDVGAGHNIFDLLSKINQEGVTILAVSHDVGFISQYIKRVFCINKVLCCHNTAEITPELIQDIYGMKVKVVRHDS